MVQFKFTTDQDPDPISVLGRDSATLVQILTKLGILLLSLNRERQVQLEPGV
jgi:hypothetical protein